MGFNLDDKFFMTKDADFKGKLPQQNIPSGTFSVRHALTKFVSLTGPLSKKSIKEFAAKCESAAERDELVNMCGMGKEAKDAFDQKIVQKNVGLIDLVLL